MKIENIMTKDFIAVNIDSDIQTVATIMRENDIGFLPVFKESKIVGVITDRDIVTRIIANKDHTLEGYLSKDLITIDSFKTINDVLEKMAEKKVKRLLVQKEGKLVGIVSLSDLIHYDNDLFLPSLKRIWEINRNRDTYTTKIDEFEL